MSRDRFGRNIHYLRVSLTDKCNLRCVYCMKEDMTFLPNPALMQDDELITLIRLFADLGFDKYRLTGGEPTIRPHVVDLVREMKSISGVNTITMTTNGVPIPQDWVSVEEELRYIRIFFQLGVRMMHLTYNRRNALGDGCGEPANAGLSPCAHHRA